MNLYHIQDCDRPMYVAADSWLDAINRWKVNIAVENEESSDDVEEPEGIVLVAKEVELILPDTIFPVLK